MDLNTHYLDIIEPIRKGGPLEDEAIRILYRQYYSQLTAYVIRNNGSEQDADDMFQETVVAFVQTVKLDKFRGEAAIGTFLQALCRNIWRNELRKRGRMQARETKYNSMEEKEDNNVGKAMELRQASATLMHMMNELGDVCRQILLQFYYEGKSMKEIVDTLDYENEQVVRNKKSKCMKKLTELLHNDPNTLEQLKNLIA